MKKKVLISLISLFTFIMLAFGISYSYLIYNENIVTADISSGTISINTSSNDNVLNFTNASPLSDNLGVLLNDYIDFTVDATTDINSIFYEIYLVPSGNNTLEEKYVKVCLTDQDDNLIVEPTLLKDLEEATINTEGKKLYVGLVDGNPSGTLNNYSKSYRFRMWIDENYNQIDVKEFGLEIKMYAKNIDSFYSVIKSKFGTTNYVQSYDTIIDSDSSNQTQDTIYNRDRSVKQTVYYFSGSNAPKNGNVIFAGYCWSILRTTDTGGIKLIYNGVAENNQCTDDRGDTTWVGVLGTNEETTMTGDAYMYAASYDYDLETGKFRLVDKDSEKKTWSKATYEDFLGKYTCFNDDGEDCDEIWYIGQYLRGGDGSSKAYTTKYNIGDLTNYHIMGTSNFNAGWTSPANVGYMYNKLYNYDTNVAASGALYGKNVKYENGMYIVYDDDINEPITSTEADNNHHYTCGTVSQGVADTTCSTVRYYYNTFHIKLSNGDTIEAALKKMINLKQNDLEEDANINVINSTIKDYLEIWYDKNLKDYEEYIDMNAVYCNNRSVAKSNNELILGGWNANGGDITKGMAFVDHFENGNLACENVTDRFSVENSKARLRNPIGLIDDSERAIISNANLQIGNQYLTMSPNLFTNVSAGIRRVSGAGSGDYADVSVSSAVRGVITLRNDVEVLDGNGSKEKPYVIGELVDRAS